MIFEPGEKIHVIIRRLFETDLRRHFIGEIVGVSESVVKVKGRAIVLNSATNQYELKPDTRVRIVSLIDARNIINIIPREAKIEDTKYVLTHERRLVVTDGETFTLDINEFNTIR
jgi:hypothetical protein